MRNTRMTKLFVSAVVAAALTMTVAACGGSDNSSDSSKSVSASADFNQADVDFATDMIPHHAQAVEMVALTDGRTLDPAVSELAEEIRGAQTPEISTMSGWLKSWNKPVPKTGAGHDMSDMNSDDSSMDMGSGMPGMMSDQEMTDLKNAPDSQFQTLWLQMMQKHHEGAVQMAKVEIAKGEYPKAVALAKSIVTSQTAEISAIKQLLAS